MPPDPFTPPVLDLSPSAIAQATHADVDSALAAIPAGHTGALLIDGTVINGTHPVAQALIVQKIGGNWVAMASGIWDGHHTVGKVAIGASW